MLPACRFQMTTHIKSICFLDCIFLYQQQQCNTLLTRSVVYGWLARLRKMTQKNHIAMIFRTHAIGSDYERKTYILDVSVVKNFGIDDTIWYGWYHMIHMIWYESWLCPLNYGFDNVAGAGGINFVHDVNIFWFDIFLTFPMQFFPIELGAEVNFGCQSLQAPKFCYNKFWIQ